MFWPNIGYFDGFDWIDRIDYFDCFNCWLFDHFTDWLPNQIVWSWLVVDWLIGLFQLFEIIARSWNTRFVGLIFYLLLNEYDIVAFTNYVNFMKFYMIVLLNCQIYGYFN